MYNIRLDDPFYSFMHDYQKALGSSCVTPEVIRAFKECVWGYYRKHKRSFSWRDSYDPYAIVVSEIMLQQTQTRRVAEKYAQFLKQFPTFLALAHASTSEVLIAWSGLGYNRRALALQGIAQKVINEHKGVLPSDPAILQTFKGLGSATAASIVAFTYNSPTCFIETNIRAVYLHVFFHHKESVSDKELLPLISMTVDQVHPRQWYYALMDCGVALKSLYKNPARKSKHYAKQSKFEGSDRQIRGAIIRLLGQKKAISQAELKALFLDERVEKIVAGLLKEGLLMLDNDLYRLPM